MRANLSFFWLDVILGRLDPAPPFWPELWRMLTLRSGGDLLPFYVVMIALAVFAPRAAIFGYLVVAVIALFRLRGDNMVSNAPTSG